MDLIPEELHSSVKCYVVCRGLKAYEDQDSDNDNIDIAVCTANNAILEIRKKQIVTSCNFEAKDAVEIQLYNQYLRAKKMKYYLIQTSSNVLVVVQKDNGYLSILQKFEDVEKFRIFDYNSYGYPQVGIWYTDSMEPYVTEFSIEREDMAMDIDEPSKNNLITDYLTKQLQELKERADQLKGELNALQTMLHRTADQSPKIFYETVFPIDETANDVLLKEETEAPLLTITDTWQKVNDEYWLLGINFWNSNKRILSNVKLSLRNSKIQDYVYRIFIPNFKNPDQLFSASAAWDVFSSDSNIPPNREAIIVAAVKLPEFVDESKHVIKCTLSCESFQCDTSLSELTAQDVVNGKYNLLADSSKTSLGRDLISFLTIDKEVIVDVKIALEIDVSMERILTKDFHMERLKGFDNENLYVNFGFLKGIILFCTYVSADPKIWRIYLLTRNTSQVFTFVNALYDLLPTGTVITSKDNL